MLSPTGLSVGRKGGDFVVRKKSVVMVVVGFFVVLGIVIGFGSLKAKSTSRQPTSQHQILGLDGVKLR